MGMSTAASTSNTPVTTQQTEIGALPFDWSVIPLISLAEKIMVGIASAATHAYRNTGVVMFRNQNIRPGLLDTEDVLYIDPEYEQTYKNKRLRAGDLLTARTGYPGTTSLVPEGFDGSQSFTTLITRPRPSAVDARYLCLYINGRSGQQYFEQAQIGGGQKNVNAAALKLLPIAMPSTETEQRAIADALTDADALIDSLEQLLTKKRQIKQGAMQELLTGKRRLPGFSAPWRNRRLSELASIQRGASPRPIDNPVWFDEASTVGWVRISDVTQSGMFLQTTTQRLSDAGIRKSRFIETGSLIMSICATVGRPVITALNTCIHDGFVVFDGLAINQRFLYYGLLNIEDEWSAHGQTGSQMNLNTGLINRTPIPVPDDKDEQAAIAQVLSDMDIDLFAIEARLTKARALKQAMAQALLTGRIRLVETNT
jgi:type I restriction enzyme, S subunit